MVQSCNIASTIDNMFCKLNDVRDGTTRYSGYEIIMLIYHYVKLDMSPPTEVVYNKASKIL